MNPIKEKNFVEDFKESKNAVEPIEEQQIGWPGFQKSNKIPNQAV